MIVYYKKSPTKPHQLILLNLCISLSSKLNVLSWSVNHSILNMKTYIERIEITKFRSFGTTEIIECDGVNIFSGGNDTGKSNVLKALNLFFNERPDNNASYNSDQDFNKWFRDNNLKGARDIVIRVKIAAGSYFDPTKIEHIGINEGFFAQKTFHDNGAIVPSFYYKDGREIKDKMSLSRADAIIRNNIRYIYIPAVRDNNFRSSIQRDLMSIADSVDKRFGQNNNLKQLFDNLENGLKNKLSNLSKVIQETLGIKINTSVTFSSLLESLGFETEGEIKIKKKRSNELVPQSIIIENRGDGIQMHFLSFLLWFVSNEDKKHYYIWGYEEPEIAYEFKRQITVADTFVKQFSHSAQIFITTHSPAFAFYEDVKGVKKYRISKERPNSSSRQLVTKVTKFEDYYYGLFKSLENNPQQAERTKLEHDIWGIEFQRLSHLLGKSIDPITGLRHIDKKEFDKLINDIKEREDQIKENENQVKNLTDELKTVYPFRIFICEDKSAITIWQNWFNQAGIKDVVIKSSKGCTTTMIEDTILELRKLKPIYQPRIFRELDRDGYSDEQISFIITKRCENYKGLINYKVQFLPVNEIENFIVMTDPYFTDQLLLSALDSNLYVPFTKTAKNNIRSCRKWDEDLFKEDTEAEMFVAAKQDIKRFMSGKDICKLKPNHKVLQVLKNMSYDKFPQELKD